MADRTTPIHSGYSIINASFSGTATAKLGCWMEYKVVSQSVENNTSTIRFYIFIANVAASGGFLVSGKYLIPKICLVDYLMSPDAMCVRQKSFRHELLLKEFLLKQ